jgi:hypothetical protein
MLVLTADVADTKTYWNKENRNKLTGGVWRIVNGTG